MRRDRIERKTPDQLIAMRRSGVVVARILSILSEAAVVGASTADLDRLARDEIAHANAVSSFLGYDIGGGVPAYPAVTCISVNDEVVHGIPGPRVLAEGDLVSIDFGVSIDGWHADSAVTVEVGTVSPAAAHLSRVTRAAMWAGIAAVRAGGRVGDVSAAVERSVRSSDPRLGIVADFTGHGIGSAMHMDPDVPNLGRAGTGEPLRRGMAIAIEPIVVAGSPRVVELDDQWTIRTRDRGLAAHWEHSVAITEGGVWVLTAADGGEAELTARGLRFGPLSE